MILEDIFSYSDTSTFMRAMSFFNSYRNKVMITVGIILILVLIVIYGSLWVLFEKAGKKGFLGIIPFYHLLGLLRMTGLPGYHFFLALIPVINLPSWFIIDREIARVYKEKPSYGILIFFFPYIFLLKLALGSNGYDRNYYYTSVNDSSNSQYVVVNTDVVDYNQGLIFDPKTNVDDVVKSAPYDPTLSNFFKDKDESENEFMAFLDMSDDARMNEEMGAQDYNAVPNAVNNMPQNNIMNEVPLTQGNAMEEPNKMSVEALLGRPTTEDINTPKPVATAPQVDMNNLFNVGIDNSMQPQNNASPVPDMNMAVQSPAMMSPAPAPVAPEPVAPVPVAVAPVNDAESDGISEEASQNISDDINKILGLDVNNIESVPVQNVTPSIPTIGGGSAVPPTNPVEVHQATDLMNGGNNLVQNAVEFASRETPQEVNSPTICPSCGTTLPNGAKFCYMCGKAI